MNLRKNTQRFELKIRRFEDMTKNEILNKLVDNKPYIEKEFEVKKIGLFGSYAKK